MPSAVARIFLPGRCRPVSRYQRAFHFLQRGCGVGLPFRLLFAARSVHLCPSATNLLHRTLGGRGRARPHRSTISFLLGPGKLLLSWSIYHFSKRRISFSNGTYYIPTPCDLLRFLQRLVDSAISSELSGPRERPRTLRGCVQRSLREPYR